MSLTLSPAEIEDLTDKVKSAAQARELAHMGIPFRVRRNGSLAVLRIHVETQPGATAVSSARTPRVRFDA